MRFGLIFFLISVAIAAAAQQQPSATPGKSTGTCKIDGSVIAGDTGQPLRKAIVTLQKVGGQVRSQYAVTDASGHFELKDIDPGRYALRASHASYVRMQYGQLSPDAPGSELTLASGQVIQDATFKLPRAAAISGHVYDEDGDPVEHAVIKALRYRYIRGKRMLAPAPSGFVRTDDQGKYRIFDLAPGQYYVSASLDAGQFGEGPSDFSYPQTFYPSTADATGASPLQLAPGDDFPGVDITLVPVKTYHIRGQVFDSADNRPAQNAAVSLRRRDDVGFADFHNEFIEDAQGDFDIGGVRPGSYYLYAELFVHDKQLQTRLSIDVVDTDINGFNVTVSAGTDLHGRVRFAGGNLDFATLRMFLEPRDQQPYSALTDADIDSNGALVFHGVSDGGYVVRVFELPPDAYLKQVLLNGQDVRESGFDVSGGQAPGTLEVIIDTNGGRLQGVVTKDGKVFTDAKVVLQPKDSAAAKDNTLVKETTTDQYGAFVIHGIRPGGYRVFAFQQIEEGAWADPNFMSRIENQGEEVEISEGTERRVQLQAISQSATGEVQ